MADVQLDPEAIISTLADQVRELVIDNAKLRAGIAYLQNRVAELEAHKYTPAGSASQNS